MAYPTPYTLQRKPYVPGARDALGNVVDTWGDPVDLPVHGIAPGAMVEASEPGRDLSMIVYSLLCPAGTVASERDLVTVDGKDFEVDGFPKDYTRGPWRNPVAGVVILLKRAEG